MYPFKRRNPLGFCKGNTEFLLIVRQRPGVLLQRVARIGKNNLAYSLLLRETVLSGCDSFAYSPSQHRQVKFFICTKITGCVLIIGRSLFCVLSVSKIHLTDCGLKKEWDGRWW